MDEKRKKGRITSGLVTFIKKGYAHCTSEIHANKNYLLLKLGSTLIANCYLPYYQKLETIEKYLSLIHI